MRRLRRDIDSYELTRLLPSAGVLLVWTWLMFDAGGFRPEQWMPAGVLIVAMAVLAMVGAGRLLPRAKPVRTALLILAAFTLWCYLSMLWSDAPGTTLEASNLLLVGLAGAWTLSLAPWRTRTATLLFLLFSSAAAIACLAGILGALSASDLTDKFEDFRFSPPLDYPNTTAAFAFMAAIPALLLAARPDSSIPAKGVGQGLATFLCAYALLPQSRGSILGGLAALTVLALTVPFRWRLTLHAFLLLVAVLIAAGPVGDVYTTAAHTGKASDALGDALTWILIASVIGTVGGLLLGRAEDRVMLDAGQERMARTAGFALAGLGVLIILGAGVAKSSSISNTLSDQWRSLKHPGIKYGGSVANQASGRLTSVDPLERYDYWRVSLDGFKANPILGMGAGGFELRYERTRRYPKPSQYPHNIVMKVLGDTGLVGVALMLAFLVVLGRGMLVGAGRLNRRVRSLMAASAAMLAYFLFHGLFDWLEAYPVLVGPALAFPLVALAVRSRAEAEATARKRGPEPKEPETPPSLPALAGVGAVVVVAFLALLGPWLSIRYREQATKIWRTDPAAAYGDLNRAASLDPFSAEPDLLHGVIALTRGDISIANDRFRESLKREDQWLPHFGIAAIAAANGDKATARRELKAAARLNARDAILPQVSQEVLSKRGLPAAEALREALTTDYSPTNKVS